MSTQKNKEEASAGVAWLKHEVVRIIARRIRSQGKMGILEVLELGCALREASGDTEGAKILKAELEGYEKVGAVVPQERRVPGFASPFPVRAIGLMDPEEIFLANREKFSQVVLTIGQPVRELELAIEQLEAGGVLALRVPAAEISGGAIQAVDDAEVYIYILPREIERIVATTKQKALEALVTSIIDASLEE